MAMPSTEQQVQRVFLITLVLNIAVAVGKIVIGTLSGALAITADGFHSTVDATANIIALFANKVASQPADNEHPYGHSRFETLGALVIGMFLLLVAWEVVSGALDRMINGGEVELTPATFAILIATLIINIGVSSYQIREAKRLNSELLLADAANTRADVFVTSSVLISMIIVAITDLVWIDTVAAIVVVGLIGKAAWEILSRTGSVLVDTAPYSPEQLMSIILSIPDAPQIIRVRSRGTAKTAHVDLELQVASDMPTGYSSEIAETIVTQLKQELGSEIDVNVYFSPNESNLFDYTLVARAIAYKRGLATHDAMLLGTPKGKVLKIHVEVPPQQTLGQAHELVSQFEQEIKRVLPKITDVITHIEPAPGQTEPEDYLNHPDGERLKGLALALLNEEYPTVQWDQIRVYDSQPGISFSMSAILDNKMTVEEAHKIIDRAEVTLRAALPEIISVTIHTEPIAEE
jgi:cation diffusion facilitator family transporter